MRKVENKLRHVLRTLCVRATEGHVQTYSKRPIRKSDAGLNGTKHRLSYSGMKTSLCGERKSKGNMKKLQRVKRRAAGFKIKNSTLEFLLQHTRYGILLLFF
jgi:hypothetical protein